LKAHHLTFEDGFDLRISVSTLEKVLKRQFELLIKLSPNPFHLHIGINILQLPLPPLNNFHPPLQPIILLPNLLKLLHFLQTNPFQHHSLHDEPSSPISLNRDNLLQIKLVILLVVLLVDLLVFSLVVVVDLVLEGREDVMLGGTGGHLKGKGGLGNGEKGGGRDGIGCLDGVIVIGRGLVVTVNCTSLRSLKLPFP